jgi:pyrroloquinoline quinone (PQQ) biosynthesis protein C
MPTKTLTVTVDRAIGSRRLLDHQYYRSWQQGALTMDELRAYAEQYRHVEAVLPEVLAAAALATIDKGARALIESNLTDEMSRPASHLELFDRFAAAVGVEDRAEATPATSCLVKMYRQAAANGAVSTLAAIAAYETQAADIASTKAESLRRHHGLQVGHRLLGCPRRYGRRPRLMDPRRPRFPGRRPGAGRGLG